MYNPDLGTFDQRDPIGYADGENLYRYCDSNPMVRTDPEGTSFHTQPQPQPRIQPPMGPCQCLDLADNLKSEKSDLENMEDKLRRLVAEAGHLDYGNFPGVVPERPKLPLPGSIQDQINDLRNALDRLLNQIMKDTGEYKKSCSYIDEAMNSPPPPEFDLPRQTMP